MTYIHHYSIIQSNFTVLKILCSLPIHSSLPARMLCFDASNQVACSFVDATLCLEVEVVSWFYYLLL